MKKAFFLLLMAIGMMTSAMVAQTTESIIMYDRWGDFTDPGDTIDRCIFEERFSTSIEFESYQWSRNDDPDTEGALDIRGILIFAQHPFTLYFTGTTFTGEIVQDSVVIIVKDWINPLPSFMMEITEENTAKFSWTATAEHELLNFWRSIDTTNWTFVKEIHIGTGNSCFQDTAVFTENIVWNYWVQMTDTCGMLINTLCMEPGMYMSVQPTPGGGYALHWKSVMQGTSKEEDDYQYMFYTIDGAGESHLYCDATGAPVMLPSSARTLTIHEHPDSYYQGAVAKWDANKRSYEVVSLSNKVENPLPDLTGVSEATNGLSIYPNPAHGRFTAEGEGELAVYTASGQAVARVSLSGQRSLELPAGLYFVSLNGGKPQKVVVE